MLRGGFLFRLLCHTKTGTGAVVPKMKQLDLHAVPTIPVPEGRQGSSNTQLSSELISAVALDSFLSPKNVQKLRGDQAPTSYRQCCIS